MFKGRGNSPHLVGAIILEDNPAGHGFVLRDLVLIELSEHAPPSSLGGYTVGEGESRNFEVKIKTA